MRPRHVAQGFLLALLAALGLSAPPSLVSAERAPARATPSARCAGLQFLGELGPQRALPPGSELVSLRPMRGAPGGPPLTLDAARSAFDTAVPLDPCDPTVTAWSYAPAGSFELTLTERRTFTLELYLGGRGVLVWPDRSRTVFDYGATLSWAPASLRPQLRRDWAQDGSCSLDTQHPHAVLFTPAFGTAPFTAAQTVARWCTHLGVNRRTNLTHWCCP